ncbi:MAG: GNAT family N-acetyltransferase [Alphaproteobacteria bacterium]|nr:GNAT family N-acetyltransferase [Alphaproteobacteria bacterium]MCB9691708.1 GNAT family N-acetyltransferase [Alphaproteobacteria bacterium]
MRLLAAAFADDAVTQHFLRQDDRNADATARFFTLALERQSLPFGEVTHIDHAATALWVPPGRWQLGWRDQLALAPEIVRIAGFTGIPRALRGLAAMERHHPAEPHMYLVFLGTHPDHRRQGLAGTLMRAMLERCDREGLPVYLENTKATNEAWYRNHGFEVAHDIPLGPGSPEYYRGMWRDPR